MKIEVETKFNVNDKVLWDKEEVEVVGINVWTNGRGYFRLSYQVDLGYCVEDDVLEDILTSK